MAQQNDDGEFSKERYVTPGKNRPLAFGGRNLVYRYSRPHLKTYGQVERELSKIDSYTRHRPSKPPKFNPYFIYSPRQLIQCDLCDLQTLKEWNDNYGFWLCVIDCFSRKLWLKPVKRKTDTEVIPKMRQILNEMGGKDVKTCESDRGAEFTSRQWRALMNEFNIKHRFANTHAAFVERVLQTIQRMVAFHMTENETRSYINILDKIVDSYNARYHRMIKMSPNEAEKEKNRLRVRLALEEYYSKAIHRKKKPKYKIGQYVRVAKKYLFKRSYDEQFDVDFYVIHDVKTHLPFPMYILRSPDGVIQSDFYYEEEITPYSSDIWKVDKVIRRRKRGRRNESLVKWLGFSNAHNSWVDDRELGDDFRQRP